MCYDYVRMRHEGRATRHAWAIFRHPSCFAGRYLKVQVSTYIYRYRRFNEPSRVGLHLGASALSSEWSTDEPHFRFRVGGAPQLTTAFANLAEYIPDFKFFVVFRFLAILPSRRIHKK